MFKNQFIMKKTNLFLTTLLTCVFFFIACKKEEYTVTFNPNGGEGAMPAQTFTEGKSQALLPNAFTYEGFLFKEWNTVADGSGVAYTDKREIYLTADLLLYAQWADTYGRGVPCSDMPTMNDIDGNTYNTVQIGTQCWMRENLKTTKYRTGEVIPVITDGVMWKESTTGAMCYYDNNIDYADKYGALYNWLAVETEHICPDGWHVPSSDEWQLIINYLGGREVAGYQMKTVYDWGDYYGSGSNESGFSALPAGIFHYIAGFYGFERTTDFWSSTEEYHVSLHDYNSWVDIVHLSSTYRSGFSVRCVKDE